MPAVTSPDISVFDLHVLYDLSGTTPFVKITNQCVGTNLDACSLIFELYSSSGILYYVGDWGTPDAAGDFVTWTKNMLQVFGHIEWSGAPFVVKAYLKDTTGNVISTLEFKTEICKPTGNAAGDKNNFGSGSVDVLVKCTEKVLYIEDVSNYSYKGLAGTLDTKSVKIVYPEDTTETVPNPFISTGTGAITVPIWFSSKGYRLIQETVIVYNFTNNSSVKIKYKYKKSFDVLCNIDLCPLVCEVRRFSNDIARNGCTTEERDKLIRISLLLNVALIAKVQPLCGIDLAEIVDEIKEIGGFTCDCTYGDAAPDLTDDSCSSPNGAVSFS